MNIMKMMQEAQKLQSRIQEVQGELELMEVEGQSGAGLVKVRLNGKGELKAMKVDPTLLKPEDADMLEDLVIAAHKDARSKSEALLQEKMKQLTGGLPLPPGMKLF